MITADGRPHTPDGGARTAATAQPGLLRRATTVARLPLGVVVSTARYLRWSSTFDHRQSGGDARDLPPALPAGLIDEQVKALGDGAGPLFHRTFEIRVRDSDLDAVELVSAITSDLDRAAPSEVVSFRKQRGRLGQLVVGDEYRVRMPAPWDGPVRVVRRDATSFRFTTMAGHLEAGQIEFRARDSDDGLIFEIESWSRAGDRLAHLVFDRLRIGKEIQLNMWAQFCLAIPRLARGHRDSPVTITTRRVEWPPSPLLSGSAPGAS